MTRRAPGAAALALFCAISFLYFGLRVVVDRQASYVGHGVDPEIFIWSFAWWPHALLHGQNPFATRAIWTPAGVNLTWTTSVPGLALLFAPLTLIAGPLAAYNVAAVLLPALAAWTAFLLCHHLTRAFVPSLVGGYLFGFSSYLLGQEEGHLHLTSVFLIPLVALVLVRGFESAIGRRRLSGELGCLLAGQLLCSTEVFFTLTLALACALLIGWATLGPDRSRLGALILPLAGGYAVAAALTAPFLYYAAAGFDSRSINAPRQFAADLLNLVVPTKLTLADPHGLWATAARFAGNNSERGAYLGLPALLAIVLFARANRQRPAGRFLLLCLATAVLFELGATLTVAGSRLLPLPLSLVDRLPLFDNVLPARIAMFAALAEAVIVASWSAGGRSLWRRSVLPGLVVVSLLPRPASHAWITHPSNPAFIAQRTYRRCLRRNEAVLVLPFGSRGDSMLWQAESDFWFRLAGGYLSPVVPPPYARFRAAHPARSGATTAADVRRLAEAERADRIVVDAARVPPGRFTAGPVTTVAGVRIFSLPGAARLPAGCAAPAAGSVP